MSDPLSPAHEWNEAQHKSFEELKAEADAKKAKRENVQPLKIGKADYGSIFRVGDRLRPEMALRLGTDQTRGEAIGTGQVELDELVPPQAFRDLDHAFAAASITTQAETQEGIREEVIYDRDEGEVILWGGEPGARMVLHPPAVERIGTNIESAAYEGDQGDESEGAGGPTR